VRVCPQAVVEQRDNVIDNVAASGELDNPANLVEGLFRILREQCLGQGDDAQREYKIAALDGVAQGEFIFGCRATYPTIELTEDVPVEVGDHRGWTGCGGSAQQGGGKRGDRQGLGITRSGYRFST